MEAIGVSALARDQGFSGHQLSLGLYQPNHEYLTSGYFSINFQGKSDHLRQVMYPVDRMPWVLNQYAEESRKYKSDFYMSMATFVAGKRRAALLQDISIVWIDFDYYKLEHFGNWTPERFNNYLEDIIMDMGLPLPSFTIASGRGIYANWVLDTALPRAALPRWKAVMRELNIKFALLGADPKATLPTQIMRVVGSTNSRQPIWYPDNEKTVRILECRTDETGNAEKHNFEYLAECILPYTREEVAAYKMSRHFEQKKFTQYSANTTALLEYLQSIRKGSLSEIRPEFRSIIAYDDAASLWTYRCEALRSIAKSWGGISDGQGRNDWCWITSNAIEWISTTKHFRYDVAEVLRELIPSYSNKQIVRSTSAITARVKAGEPLYYMKNSTLCQKLNISEELLKLHMPKLNSHLKSVNVGVMGFDPIRNKLFPEYLTITKHRQSLSAERTNLIQKSANEDKKVSARIMKATGMSNRAIGRELGVDHKTVAKWLNS